MLITVSMHASANPVCSFHLHLILWTDRIYPHQLHKQFSLIKHQTHGHILNYYFTDLDSFLFVHIVVLTNHTVSSINTLQVHVIFQGIEHINYYLYSHQAMLRALSTCRNHGGYERLVEEPVNLSLLDGKLKRAKSVPASVFGSSKSRKLAPELALQNISPAKPSSREVSKSHPLFSLFNNRRKKKPTARPEFARYLQYVKEGGIWL